MFNHVCLYLKSLRTFWHLIQLLSRSLTEYPEKDHPLKTKESWERPEVANVGFVLRKLGGTNSMA